MRSVHVILMLLSVIVVREVVDAQPLFVEGMPPLQDAATQAASTIPHFAELARELSKAVVNISVEARDREQEGVEREPSPPSGQRRGPADRPLFSMGSGFIISPVGHIVTNNHVIERATKVVVRLLDDKTEYPATVIGRDGKTDVALIKIEPKGVLPTVFLGDSDRLEVGEWVMAIGNQFQLGQTVTAGIVSALARKVPTREAGPYDSYIQTDASINPGSSGGPLFNSRGQVIGVNTAIFSPGRSGGGGPGFNIGIGFAIPVNSIKGILTQLKDQGKVTRGFLGVIIQPVTNEVAEAMNLPSPDGALVADVVEKSPAAKAGLQRRDVIVAFNHRPVRDHDDLPMMVASMSVGSSVEIEYLRKGATGRSTVVIEELKDREAALPAREQPQPNRVGLIVSPLPPSVDRSAGASPRGVLVSGVEPGSDAQEAGLVKGDIIEEIGEMSVKTVSDLERVIKELVPQKPVLVLVRREEGTRFLTLTVTATAG